MDDCWTLGRALGLAALPTVSDLATATRPEPHEVLPFLIARAVHQRQQLEGEPFELRLQGVPLSTSALCLAAVVTKQAIEILPTPSALNIIQVPVHPNDLLYLRVSQHGEVHLDGEVFPAHVLDVVHGIQQLA